MFRDLLLTVLREQNVLESPHKSFFMRKGFQQIDGGWWDPRENRLKIDELIGYLKKQKYKESKKSRFEDFVGLTQYVFTKDTGMHGQEDIFSFDSEHNQYVRKVQHKITMDKS